MSGSLAFFIYDGDILNGSPTSRKLIELDESNTRALGYAPATQAEVNALVNKRLFKTKSGFRDLTCTGITSAGKTLTRNLTCLQSDNALFQTGGSIVLPVLTGGNNGTIENVVFRVTHSNGERKSFASATDTGLDDGTT